MMDFRWILNIIRNIFHHLYECYYCAFGLPSAMPVQKCLSSWNGGFNLYGVIKAKYGVELFSFSFMTDKQPIIMSGYIGYGEVNDLDYPF